MKFPSLNKLLICVLCYSISTLNEKPRPSILRSNSGTLACGLQNLCRNSFIVHKSGIEVKMIIVNKVSYTVKNSEKLDLEFRILPPQMSFISESSYFGVI